MTVEPYIGKALANLAKSDSALMTGITASADELNILDGVTATASELNVLDGIEATVEELNLLAGAGAAVASGTQAATIAAATANYTTGGLDTEAKLITAINAANGKLNAVIAALKAFGIVAES